MKRIALGLVLLLGLVPVTISHAADAPAKPVTRPAPVPVDSLALLEKAVARDSTNFDKLYRLGIYYMDRDRSAEASRIFLRARAVRPKDTHNLVNLGAAMDATGRTMDAQKYYREALTIAPDDSIASCRLASSLYSQLLYPEAIDLLREVREVRPRAHCAYFTMGVAFADAGLYRDAIRMWKKVAELAPNSPEAISARESIEVLERFVHTSDSDTHQH